MFEKAIDAKTGALLFTEQLRAKADAVLELAHEGYFSDVVMCRLGLEALSQPWKAEPSLSCDDGFEGPKAQASILSSPSHGPEPRPMGDIPVIP